MNMESAHESELTSSDVEIEEQSELVQTEKEMSTEVLQEKNSETTSTELQFNTLIPESSAGNGSIQ